MPSAFSLPVSPVSGPVDENWAEVRIKGLKREIRNIKEALKRKSKENE